MSRQNSQFNVPTDDSPKRRKHKRRHGSRGSAAQSEGGDQDKAQASVMARSFRRGATLKNFKKNHFVATESQDGSRMGSKIASLEPMSKSERHLSTGVSKESLQAGPPTSTAQRYRMQQAHGGRHSSSSDTGFSPQNTTRGRTLGVKTHRDQGEDDLFGGNVKNNMNKGEQENISVLKGEYGEMNLRMSEQTTTDQNNVEFIVKPYPIFMTEEDFAKNDLAQLRRIMVHMSQHFEHSMTYRRLLRNVVLMETVKGRKRVFDLHPNYVLTDFRFNRFPLSNINKHPLAKCLPFITLDNGCVHLNPALPMRKSNEPDELGDVGGCEVWVDGLKDLCAEHQYKAQTAMVWAFNASCCKGFYDVEICSKVLNFIKETWISIKVLNLANCDLDDGHVPALMEYISYAKDLTTLILTGNSIGGEGMAHIIKEFIPQNRSATYIEKSSHRRKHFQKISAEINHKASALDRSILNEAETAETRNKVWEMRFFFTLKISHNPIEDVGAEALCEALSFACKYMKINLEAVNCKLSEGGKWNIFKCGMMAGNLTALDVRQNSKPLEHDDLPSYFNLDGMKENRGLVTWRPGSVCNSEEFAEIQRRYHEKKRAPAATGMKSVTKAMLNANKNMNKMINPKASKNSKKNQNRSKNMGEAYGYTLGTLDFIFSVLEYLPLLRCLDLTGLNLGKSGLDYLCHALTMPLDPVDDDVPDRRRHKMDLTLPFLTTLVLSNCRLTTITHKFATMVCQHPFMRVLDLSKNVKLKVLDGSTTDKEEVDDGEESEESEASHHEEGSRARKTKSSGKTQWSRILLHRDGSPSSVVTLRLDGCTALSDADVKDICQNLTKQRQWVMTRFAKMKYRSGGISRMREVYRQHYTEGRAMENCGTLEFDPPLDLRLSAWAAFVTQRREEEGRGRSAVMIKSDRDETTYDLDRDLSEIALAMPRSAWNPSRANDHHVEEIEYMRAPSTQAYGAFRWYRWPTLGKGENRFTNNIKEKAKWIFTINGDPTCHMVGNPKMQDSNADEDSFKRGMNNELGRIQLPYHENFFSNENDRALECRKKSVPITEFTLDAIPRISGLGAQALHLTNIRLTESKLKSIATYLRHPTGWYKGLACDDQTLDDEKLFKVFLKMPAPTAIFCNISWERTNSVKSLFVEKE